MDESVKLYAIKWRYAILSSASIRFRSKDWFNMEDVIGEDAAKYYGQAEAVTLLEEDEVIVRERLSAYMQ